MRVLHYIFAVPVLLFASSILPDTADAQPRSTGLVRENPQVYSTFRSAPKHRAYLPPSVDLTPYFPEPKDQGAQGSCSAWATAYAMRSYYERRKGVATGDTQKANITFSPSYVYNQVRDSATSCDDGTRISDTLRLMKNQGVAPSTQFPYQASSCQSLPDTNVKQTANRFKIDNWKRVNVKRMDDMKGNLADGHPIAIGFFIDNDFNWLDADDIYTKTDLSEVSYGHAMVLTGYDEEKQAFRVFNSWGTGWADKGLSWISYAALQANLDSAFVMDMEVAQSAPKPKKVKETVQKPKPLKVQPQVPAIKPVPQIPDITQHLRKKINNFKCFALSRETSKGQLVGIRGYVSTQTDYYILKNTLNAHPHGDQVSLNVNIRPWPQCEALQTFSSPLAARQKMKVETLSGEELKKSVYKAGDKLVVRVTSPDFPSYLYVTYLQSGGEAVHLVRGAANNGKAFAPNTVVTFGNSPDQPTFRIAEPFGDEMIMVIATKEPLFDETYGIVEEERAYLTRFRKGILTKLGRKVLSNVAAMTADITTQPK